MAEYIKNYINDIDPSIDDILLSEVKNYNNDKIIDDHIVDKNNVKQYTYGNFINYLKQQFSISDVDYSVIIIAKNYSRFKIIYSFLIGIISESLNEISIFFDDLYENKENLDKNIRMDNNDKESVTNFLLYSTWV